ncbi:MAG: hypothetical protein DRH11_12550 [Deltaproteobacteria bacterium]|nr:MAG: hypothetical protein DRH11_12550 [Deltaproteobacteria bacterium]
MGPPPLAPLLLIGPQREKVKRYFISCPPKINFNFMGYRGKACPASLFVHVSRGRTYPDTGRPASGSQPGGIRQWGGINSMDDRALEDRIQR